MVFLEDLSLFYAPKTDDSLRLYENICLYFYKGNIDQEIDVIEFNLKRIKNDADLSKRVD